MQGHGRRPRGVRRAGIVIALAAAGAAAMPAGATAGDDYKCGAAVERPPHGAVQYCPLWMPERGHVPVHALGSGRPEQIGRLNDAGNANWFICQMEYGSISYTDPAYPRWHNTWWALTVSDDGKKGWVSEVYFKGGGNDEADGNLRRCGSSGGAPPATGDDDGGMKPRGEKGGQKVRQRVRRGCVRGPFVKRYLTNPGHSFVRVTWQARMCRDDDGWALRNEPTIGTLGAGDVAGIGLDFNAVRMRGRTAHYHAGVRQCMPYSVGYKGVSMSGFCTASRGAVDIRAIVSGRTVRYSFKVRTYEGWDIDGSGFKWTKTVD